MSEPLFHVWKLTFFDRPDFEAALRCVAPSDIGHADMILTYNDRAAFIEDRHNLIQAGILRFNEETPL